MPGSPSVPMIPPALELERVSAGYLSGEVLSGVSLSFRRGEFTAVCGPNGSGKTTLLCAAAGLCRLVGGSVRLSGELMGRANAHLLRRKIGFVPQYFEVDARFPISAREVVESGRPAGKGWRRDRETDERVGFLAGTVGLGGLLDKPFGQLSGGEKKKALIARALFQDPEIMFLDEMFSWLDGSSRARMFDFLERTHRERQLTTLLVTHDRRVVERLCSRVVVLEGGKVAWDGPRADFERRGGNR